jgi:hypothetical protein
MEILDKKDFKIKIKKLYQEEKNKIIKERWKKLSIKERMIVIELHNIIYPNNKIVLSESKWYNTVMDFAGLIPGIGSGIDLYNGFSYWSQGDKLYAILSWIGAIPAFGDLIAAPVINALKIGGRGAELFKAAVAAKDVVKIAETAKNVGGPIAKMVETAPKWSANLLKVMEQASKYLPFGKGFYNTVKSWLSVFGLAGKEMTTFAKMGRSQAKSLMRNTRWYMGLLDWLGVSNFKGSVQDLNKQIPNLDDKMVEFMNTPEGQKLSTSVDGTTQTTPVIPPPTAPPSASSSKSPLAQAVDIYNNPVEFLVSLI